MLSKVLSTVRGWVVRRKALFAAVIRVAAKPALAYATGDQNFGAAYGDVLGEGLAQALDLLGEEKKENLKAPAAAAEIDEVFQRRLDEMAQIASPLLDKLEQLSETVGASANLDAVETRLDEVLRKHVSLQAELGRITPALREQVLSLPRIEAKLDEIAHVALKLPIALEEFKRFLIQSPLFGDWEQFRRADPEAVKLVIEADAHFLAGRRHEGIACLQRLFGLRGVGNATLAHHLGLHQMGAGDLPAARTTLAMFPDGAPLPEHLSQTIAAASTFSRGGGQAWRCLPRGFEIGRKYRIEAEIGRGGMASVYRAAGIDRRNAGRLFAVKVPAPGLLNNEEMIQRFVREIDIAEDLSVGRPGQIVLTLGYEVFDDPHGGGEMYALVLEHIDGESLARFLARRKTENRPLTRDEIVRILTPVCEGLQLAHERKDPIIHRDGKPSNVMLTSGGQAKLMDFGIARLLDDADALTRTNQVLGTPDYLPPEVRLPKGTVDPRTDVYLLGCLLQEMMTFHPCGDVETRPDLPAGWADLVADATSRVRGKRPGSAREFLERLLNAPLTLDAIAEQNRKQRRDAEEQAREHLSLGEFAEGLKAVNALEEHRRPAKLIAQLQRVGVLLPRLEAIVKADRLQRWMRSMVEELATLCSRRDDLKRLLSGEKLKEPLKPGSILENSLGMKFAWVPPTAWYEKQLGRPYLMGEGDGQRPVVLTRGFWMAVTPTTQAQWMSVFKTNDTPSNFKGADRPVEQATWDECIDFCRRLQDLEAKRWLGFTPRYDLPTEAEWEYAYRAGTTMAYFFGDSDSQLGDYAWFNGNSGNQTQPVRGKKPNPWGLYDMAGNVWEWCKDWYADNPPKDDNKDPQGCQSGDARVLRGGSWDLDTSFCRAASRFRGAPGARNDFCGFRVCVRLD